MLIMIITKVLEIKRYSPAPQNWKYILKKERKKGKEAQHYTDSLTSNKTEGRMSSPKNRKPREGKSLSEPGPSAALPSPGAPQLVSRSRQVTAALGPRKLTPGSNSIKNNTVRI